jgi:hypothetical protein
LDFAQLRKKSDQESDMKFDEVGKVTGITRRRALEAQKVLDRAKDIADLAKLWVSNSDRELTLCNGVDDGEHFESLCIVLREDGKHVAERYISLARIERESWGIVPASRFVNWYNYHHAIESSGPQHIADFLDLGSYKEALGIEPIDPLLGTPVLNRSSAQRVAISHGVSPYSEATFSLLTPEFFEGDKTMLRRWGKRSLLWLFTTLRSPFKVSGIHPGILDSFVSDIEQKAQKETTGVPPMKHGSHSGAALLH